MADAAAPRICVITAVRDNAPTVERAIASVLTQDYTPLEYRIRDGGSTDGTVAIIARYAARLTDWQSAPDGGPDAAYNAVLRANPGPILGLLNADDWYEPGILQAVGAAFRADSTLDLVSCACRIVTADGAGGLRELDRITGDRLALRPGAVPVPNARFFHRRVFEQAGYFLTHDPAGRRIVGTDLEFMFRLSLIPLRHCILPQLGYTYLAHPRSETFMPTPAGREALNRSKLYIAGLYLPRRDLPPAARREVRAWHRQATRELFATRLRAGDYGAALRLAGQGVARHSPLWLGTALKILLRGH